MGKGPKTPGWLENLIVAEWLKAKGAGKELVAKEVRENLSRKLVEGDKLHFLPSLRKVQAVLTEARRREGAKPEKEKALDDPWNLGAPAEHGIPASALPDLLAIWRRAIVGDTRFTIRMAVWAARLRHVVTAPTKRERIDKLYQSAMSYAGKERVAKVLERDYDTRFLDSNLAFTKEDGEFDWGLWVAAWKVGAFPLGEGPETLDALMKKIDRDKAIELWLPRIDSDEVREIREMLRACPSWPPIDTESAKECPELRDVIQSANARNDWWEDLLILQLRRIGRTAGWREMAKEERQKIVRRLVEDRSLSSLIDIFNELGDTESAEELLKVKELRKEVGYEE